MKERWEGQASLSASRGLGSCLLSRAAGSGLSRRQVWADGGTRSHVALGSVSSALNQPYDMVESLLHLHLQSERPEQYLKVPPSANWRWSCESREASWPHSVPPENSLAPDEQACGQKLDMNFKTRLLTRN